MKYVFNVFFCGFILFTNFCSAQVTPHQETNDLLDSLYIEEFESKGKRAKLLHAEPLYIDLIRDLGAHKGEKEWNVGYGMLDNRSYDRIEALVEYEWAPMDRLGLEIELPFSIYTTRQEGSQNEDTPQSKLNSLKLAGQYTLLVNEKYKTSMALGYIHEFELAPFKDYGRGSVWQGNVFNPFLVVAKRFYENWHSLIYTGPRIERLFDQRTKVDYDINTNFHYMITGTRNFVGLEFNKSFGKGDFDMTIRPQMRLGISENLMIGIVAGIPVNRENQGFSSFFRVIYEPGH